MTQPMHFPYDLDRRWSLMFAALRVNDRDGVDIVRDDSGDSGDPGDSGTGLFRATFGRVTVETPLDNIHHTQVTGPHRWYTAVGLRLSFADDGLTFGTNHRAGLCIEFIEKIPKVIGGKNHSALWVSVADPAGLAAAIGR